MANPTTTQQGTGFVSLADYLGANSDAVNNETDAIVNPDAQAAQTAKGEAAGVGIQAFQNAASGTNVDPTSLADYSQTQQDLANANTNIQGLSNTGGIATQLKNTYGTSNGGESQDQSAFDANLVGGSTSAQGKIASAQDSNSNLADYLDNIVSGDQAAGTQAYQDAQTVAQQQSQTDQADPGSGDQGVQVNNSKNHPDGPSRRSVGGM